MTRKPLPAGTRIKYLNMTATVIQDTGGATLVVYSDEDKEPVSWLWCDNGVECKVIEDVESNKSEDKFNYWWHNAGIFWNAYSAAKSVWITRDNEIDVMQSAFNDRVRVIEMQIKDKAELQAEISKKDEEIATLRSCQKSSVEAITYALQVFMALIHRGAAPPEMLASNGGKGLEPLTDALNGLAKINTEFQPLDTYGSSLPTENKQSSDKNICKNCGGFFVLQDTFKCYSLNKCLCNFPYKNSTVDK